MQISSNAEHDLRTLQARYDQLVKETEALEHNIERRTGQIGLLQRVGLDIASGLTLGETLQRIVGHAVNLLDASAGSVALTQADGALEVMTIKNLADDFIGMVFQPNQGLVGRVMGTQKPLRVEHYNLWDGAFYSGPVPFEYHAAIGVPMLYQDRVVGVIAVFDSRPERQMTDEDQQVLEALAAPAAVATANAELYSRAHRLSQRLSVLLATELQLSTQATHLNVMLNTVCQTVISLFGCNGASIWLWHSPVLERVESRFIDSVRLPVDAYHWNEGLPGRALAQNVPIVEDDPTGTDITRAAMPMLWQGQPVGVLVVTYSRVGLRFSRDDIDLLSLFCQSVGAAIVNTDLLTSLQSERDRLETILTSTLDPVLVADRTGRLVLINPSAASALHAGVDQPLLEVLDNQIVPPDSSDSVQQSIEAGSPFTFTMRNGHTVYSVRAAPLRQPEQGWVLVLRDVTGLKELEELKTRMIHMMSHDLKNPLTGIIGLSQMLVKKSDGFSSRQKDYIVNIASSALRMEDLINNILDLERASSSGLNTQYINGDILFRRLISEFKAEATSKSQTLELDLPDRMPTLNVDETQFYQALANLVGNALKYTPVEGRIQITVSVEGIMLRCVVQDNGMGIPRDKQDRLFERFYRVRSSETSHIPGTGLGLSLVKAVIEAHGGAVWVESDAGKGSTFHLEAPVVAEEQAVNSSP